MQQSMTPEALEGVFAVPPLARKADHRRSIDFEQNDRILRHVVAGGIKRFLYGGNAFLYHITLRDYEALLEWLSAQDDALWMIPAAGPAFGRAIDQAELLGRYRFPCVMMLPCCDPRDAAGIERGYREVAEAAGMPLVIYLKDEDNLGADREAGLDVVGRLVDGGVCVAVKYAVVRPDPRQDAYLEGLLRRVDARIVISGMGERPAVVHLRDWPLRAFTTGSGCIQPKLCQSLYEACSRKTFEKADAIHALFMPLEDLRDAWHPGRVLHVATELSGIARTGPILPYLSPLPADQARELASVARALVEAHETHPA